MLTHMNMEPAFQNDDEIMMMISASILRNSMYHKVMGTPLCHTHHKLSVHTPVLADTCSLPFLWLHINFLVLFS